MVSPTCPGPLGVEVRGEMKAELKELRAHLPDKDAEASAEEAILEKLEEATEKPFDTYFG